MISWNKKIEKGFKLVVEEFDFMPHQRDATPQDLDDAGYVRKSDVASLRQLYEFLRENAVSAMAEETFVDIMNRAQSIGSPFFTFGTNLYLCNGKRFPFQQDSK